MKPSHGPFKSNDFDFVLGRRRFKGTGWRGIIALISVLAFQGTYLWLFAETVKPALYKFLQMKGFFL